jgi:hypothetical protein
MFKKFVSLSLISILVVGGLSPVNAGSGADHNNYIDGLCIGDTVTLHEIANRFESHLFQYYELRSLFDYYTDKGYFTVKHNEYDSDYDAYTAIKKLYPITFREICIFHDEVYHLAVNSMRTELDISPITEDSNGLLKGRITFWDKDKWNNIRTTIPNHDGLSVEIANDTDILYDYCFLKTDNSGVAHIGDLGIYLCDPGNYTITVKNYDDNTYGDAKAVTVFNCKR